MSKHDEYTERQIKNLGKRIKNLRKEKEANYEQFAYKHELGRSQYGGYETGKDMRFSSLLRVLNALDISLAEFFGDGFEGVDKKAD